MDLIDPKRDTFYLARRPHPGQASQQMVREVETRYSNSRASATNNTETSVQYNMVYSTVQLYATAKLNLVSTAARIKLYIINFIKVNDSITFLY